MKKTQKANDTITAKVMITNRRGLHARASAKFVQCTQRFQASIHVTCQGERVGGSSIMGLLMLQAAPGSELLLEISGQDAKEALDALVHLVESKFDEDREMDDKRR